jgi:hypothetical protein
MEITIRNTTFKKYEDFWLSNIYFDGTESSFEIFQESLNEKLISQIIERVEGGFLINLKATAIPLLKNLSEIFWGHGNNNLFSFSGFMIDSNFNQCDFRMCFHCHGQNNFYDYANWFIDIKDFRIIGCWRSQL